MKTSPLFETFKSLNAEFDNYHDWQLPKSVSNLGEEYSAIRDAAAMMERPYFDILKVSGKDHADLLHRMTTNELRNLKPGEGQINIFTNEKGRIIDRVVLQKHDDSMMLTISPGNAKKIAEWIETYTFIEDVKIEDLSSIVDTLTLFGPNGSQILGKVFDQDFSELPAHHLSKTAWKGKDVQIASTDELGVPGYNLFLDFTDVAELWQELVNAGSQVGLKPIGGEVYNVARIEAGWPVYGKDFDDTINPHEARMGPYINFDKGCYIGQEVVARLDTYEKVQKHLSGILLEGDSLPNEHDPILIDDRKVGHLTSITHSIGLDQNVALGYVRTKYLTENASVVIETDKQNISGKLVKLPFVG
ncbi:aminomethyl transferase family protein [candidate division KSB1 bacterium]|nr:aminomethyl transferase family protein [candidate division KSB1 bacterium]NIR73383.1 aminomethyl transferase family protein [candidate division KSB1 bacterium]NIS25258.1 aminomethyl transferase family protein [candidate division KSB1 bacterium]NIT72162.1 aminomethyl transferase family protein [candidate division KSB1 bacterium]NIU25967.1 aminomethyl transferase family protein [candidate division KSB1 bacterium]